MKRAFLYIRVSTEEQALHGLSIEAQTLALKSWAEENGHRIAGTYVDAGISARKPASKRPGLQQLLEDVRAGKGDLVVFTKLDRWFRNISEYYKVQEVLECCHVDWRTIQEDYDTSTASGRLKINIMLSVAQDEADRTSERIKAINEMKRQKLEPLTGDCMPGYKIEGKRYIKDPEKEAAVSAFFQTYMASGSISRASRHVLEHYGLKISYQKAHKMLKSTAYYGRYFDADGMTPPYITKEEFDRIQAMRRHIVRKTAKNRVYLFSGIIFCGECGGRISGRVNTNQETRYYNCTSHYQKLSGCKNGANITEKKIEAYILENVASAMDAKKLEVEQLTAMRKARDYKSEFSALRAKLGRLKELYLDGLISMEEYKADWETLSGKLDALAEESANLELPNFTRAEKLLSSGWEAMYGGLNPEQKQEFLRILVKQVRIYPDRHIEFDIND